MNPIAFSLFGLDIRWYGIFIATGMVVAILLSSYTSKIKNINYDYLLNAVLIALPCGIIGARLYYVVFEWGYYSQHLNEIFAIRNGGLAIHGGLLFGIGAGAAYMIYKKQSILKNLDAVVPGIILAQAIGRWGNFMNQEAHGGPVSAEFISKFPEFIQKGMLIDGTYYHPTFLYESIWNVIVFIILMILLKKCVEDGVVAFSYIGLYSLGRFFIEGLRTDSLMIFGLRIAQIVSLVGILAWIGYLIYVYAIKKRKKRIFS